MGLSIATTAAITVAEALRRARPRWVCVGLLAAALLLVGVSPAAAARPGFFGVVHQTPPSAADLNRMRGTVGVLRIPFYWSQLQPERGRYELAALDRIVAAAAERGLRVLPFVYGSPRWLRRDPAMPSLGATGRAAWAAFLARLVHRYGPRGTLWSVTSRDRPIRVWQIWNEPNFRLFWRPHPSPAGYARLLRVSAGAIRRADPGARIVSAGVAPVEAGMLPATFLRRLYRVPGVRGSFDLVGLHPYSSTVAGVVAQVRQARLAMARGGDARKPLRITELGVASGGPYPNAFDRGPRGQARYLRHAYRLLFRRRARWRIAGVDWFAWADLSAHDRHCVFCQYAGLFDVRGRAKPAWRAYRRAVTAAGQSAVR